MAKMIPEDILAEMAIFSFHFGSTVTLKPAPIVYLADLWKAIVFALDTLNA